MALCVQVRAGEPVSNFEIMKFAQLFNDELTLDNLERIHLVNLCRFVGIQPFGTDAFLVARLRTHLANIKVRGVWRLGFRAFRSSTCAALSSSSPLGLMPSCSPACASTSPTSRCTGIGL